MSETTDTHTPKARRVGIEYLESGSVGSTIGVKSGGIYIRGVLQGLYFTRSPYRSRPRVYGTPPTRVVLEVGELDNLNQVGPFSLDHEIEVWE